MRASTLYDKNPLKIDFLSPQGTGEQIKQSWNENQIKKGKKEKKKDKEREGKGKKDETRETRDNCDLDQ